MFDEHGAPDEGLATLAADVRLLPRVQPLVAHQVGALAEGVTAFAALVGLLAIVDAQVLCEVGAVAEGLTAMAALVRLLARVDAVVLHEAPPAPEALAALVTGVRLLPRVDALVLQQQRVVLEALPAGLTAVRLGAPWAHLPAVSTQATAQFSGLLGTALSPWGSLGQEYCVPSVLFLRVGRGSWRQACWLLQATFLADTVLTHRHAGKTLQGALQCPSI